MRVARTIDGLPHENTLALRKLKLFFQCFAGKHGTDAARGIANVDYTVKVDGDVVDQGKTAADGSVELLVPAGRRVELLLLGTTYDLKIENELKPYTTPIGHQQRLSGLGYDAGTHNGAVSELFDRATLEFQGDEDLDPNGDVTPGTQNKLLSVYGW